MIYKKALYLTYFLQSNYQSESLSSVLNDSEQSPKQALGNHTKLLDLISELKKVESGLNPELPSRNDESWHKFLNWIDTRLNQNEMKLSDKLGVVSMDKDAANLQDEWSLITKVPIEEGAKVFSISRSLLLSSETAYKDLDLFDFIKKDSIASGMQNVVLALHLLNEHSKQDRSQWWPYLSILPRRILPVLTMDKCNLAHLTASAHFFEILKMIRAIARQYSYFFKRLQATNLPLSKTITHEYYCWGVSVVCSRQNEIPAVDRRSSCSSIAHALIPMLDMCNHDSKSNQAAFEANHVSLISSKHLEADSEITINYGNRSSGDFYIHNGFVPQDVPHDVLPLTIVLNKQESLYATKAKLLKTLNMPTFGKFKLTRNDHMNRHKRDPHLTMFLIVYFLNEEEAYLMMDSENPVGVADEVYEFVQYKQDDYNANTNGCNSTEVSNSDNNVDEPENEIDKDKAIEKKAIEAMKVRLAKCTREYLSRRSAISIALIDRVLSGDNSLDLHAQKLLEHEKTIYASYVIKN